MSTEDQIKTIRIIEELNQEVRALRRRNEILDAKVEVMELFACTLHTRPAERTQAMCVDICHEATNHCAKLKQVFADSIQPKSPVAPEHVE